jgi:hypothetical protein
VRLEVNGRTVLDKAHVTTKTTVEVAEMLTVALDPDPGVLSVAVATRRTAGTLTIGSAQAASVAISLTDSGDVTFTPSRSPIRVM